MEKLADITASYYAAQSNKAIKGIAHKTFESRYPKDACRQWVRKLDIYDLEKEMANFSLYEELVDMFGQYTRQVAKELANHFAYEGIKLRGRLSDIGSCHDGSKVGQMNEVDNLYVLESDIIIEKSNPKGLYRIFINCNKHEVVPRSIRDQFADVYGDIISRHSLPEWLGHSGYNSPCFSGLRYNGPAATSQFYVKINSENTLLTWDMTPTFALSQQCQVHRDVRKCLQPILEKLAPKMVRANFPYASSRTLKRTSGDCPRHRWNLTYYESFHLLHR